MVSKYNEKEPRKDLKVIHVDTLRYARAVPYGKKCRSSTKATDEDKLYGIDHWASLFKAGTWEELKAMAKENKAYEEAAKTMFELSSDEYVREQCRRREEYYRQIRT